MRHAQNGPSISDNIMFRDLHQETDTGKKNKWLDGGPVYCCTSLENVPLVKQNGERQYKSTFKQMQNPELF